LLSWDLVFEFTTKISKKYAFGWFVFIFINTLDFSLQMQLFGNSG